MSGSHFVEAGDTLSEIAQKYGLSAQDLIKWNGIKNPDAITVGQKIQLSGHESVDVDGNPPSQGPGDREYVVKSGDTLSGIAQVHATSVKAIQTANSIANPDLIVEGQKLIIPDNPH